MAKQTIVKLTDDLDGSNADETVEFAIDGKVFQIDLSKKNAAALRRALQPYMEAGRQTGRSGGRPRAARGGRRAGSATLFSQLDAEEKERFRAWAGMPTARRISDARVQAWIDAGRP
jgi:hypothetical protein